MDNLHAEKFAIGANEAQYGYDGSGISPEEQGDDVRYEGDPADKVTFEDDPETSEVSSDELKKSVVEKETETEGEEMEDGTNYTNILLIGGLLLALLFYKKK